MIVDLMCNDFFCVCVLGSIWVDGFWMVESYFVVY